jgi:hypothetical protein
MSSYAGLANGMRLAAAVDQRLHAVVDPVKRSEELATRAVFQVLMIACWLRRSLSSISQEVKE